MEAPAPEFLVKDFTIEAYNVQGQGQSLNSQAVRMLVSNGTTLEVQYPRRTRSIWDLRQDSRFWGAMTMEQYQEQKDTMSSSIRGPLQCGTTAQDSLNALSYDLQKGITKTTSEGTMVVTWIPSTMSAMMQQMDQSITMQSFEGVTTLVQINKDRCYNLTPQEQETLVIFELGQFNSIIYKDEFSLQRGYTWAWHQPLLIREAILTGTMCPQLKGIINQSLIQTTVSNLRFLPPEAQLTIVTHISLNNLAIPAKDSDEEQEEHNDAQSPKLRARQAELQLLDNGVLRLQEVPTDNDAITGMEVWSIPIIRR